MPEKERVNITTTLDAKTASRLRRLQGRIISSIGSNVSLKSVVFYSAGVAEQHFEELVEKIKKDKESKEEEEE